MRSSVTYNFFLAFKTLTGLSTLSMGFDLSADSVGRFRNYIIVLMICATGSVFGQTTPPVSVPLQTGGRTHYHDGYNYLHDDLNEPPLKGTPPNDAEVRDSVTVTSHMRYFVLPNPNISPEYEYDTPAKLLDFSKVNSTFEWEIVPVLPPVGIIGVLVPVGNDEPLTTINWLTVGTGKVIVKEMPNAVSGAQLSAKETVMEVAVIRKPSVAFNTESPNPLDPTDLYYRVHCVANLISHTETFKLDTETASSHIRIKHTVTKDGAATTLGASEVLLTGDNKDEFTITFTEYGMYVITIEEVTDRVSRNSFDEDGKRIVGIVGEDESTKGKTFTFHLMPPVNAGKIYRVPNNFNF